MRPHGPITDLHPAGTGDHGGIALEQVGRFDSGQFDEDAGEIVAVGYVLSGTTVHDIQSP